MRRVTDDNVFSDDWGEQEPDWSGGGARSKRLPRGDGLGATVYELDPGNFVVYHFHHLWEELLVVLAGRPTLRTPVGSRALDAGDVVHFPIGPAGAHALRNESDEVARVLMVSTRGAPEVVEYPDLGQLTVQGPTGSQTGEQLWLVHDVSAGT
jgi:uncharacterized cupin superfamily protein